MSPSLSHFPDLCLLGMFKHIPLDEVIRTVGLVCKNWARVQRDELKYRRSLVVTYSEQEHKEIEFPYGSDLIEHVRNEDGSSWLKVPSLDKIQFNTLQTCPNMTTSRLSDLVMNTMPNITHLTIEQKSDDLEESTDSSLQQMIRLIKHYSNKLVSLNLDYFYHGRNRGDAYVSQLNNLTALFDSINQLQSLRHLQLNLNYPKDFPLEMLSKTTKLSILSRLDTFTTRNTDKFFIDSLREHANENVCLYFENKFLFKHILKFNSETAAKFIRIGINDDVGLTFQNYSQMHLFCSRFTSLQTLDLVICIMPMTMLARCLSQLSQLVHLKLFIMYVTGEPMSQHAIVQVPSVRLLTMTINFQSHRHSECLHLAEIFPNLQVLSVYYFKIECSVCEYSIRMATEPNFHPRIEQCLRLARKSFRNCTNLHTVKLDGFEQLQNLLPQGLITVDQL